MSAATSQRFTIWLAAFTLMVGLLARPAYCDHHIGDICRIKGQEENSLHGVGLVVGLKGTGDGDSKPTMRALAQYMTLMGHRLTTSPQGQLMLDELKGMKNVALVSVTATVPAAGAQQGDSLDCIVSALSAKSLEGGKLILTELRGPIPGDPTVYGLAQGLISVDDIARPQTGRISLGCQVERKFQNEFVKDGKLMLIMDKDHAAFQNTSYLESRINDQPDFRSGDSSSRGIAKAIDQVKIEVTIPPDYADNPALFASHLLETRIPRPQTDTKVIINKRKQVIIVGADVEIGPVAVMHGNRLIQVGGEQLNEFVAVDPGAETSRTKLDALVAALNALKVPAEDVIDIIESLKQKGALFGELIIE